MCARAAVNQLCSPGEGTALLTDPFKGNMAEGAVKVGQEKYQTLKSCLLTRSYSFTFFEICFPFFFVPKVNISPRLDTFWLHVKLECVTALKELCTVCNTHVKKCFCPPFPWFLYIHISLCVVLRPSEGGST